MIKTREFVIEDYDAAFDLWKRVEGLEIAEGDDRESIRKFLNHNPEMSRVATDEAKLIGVALCGNDGRRGHIYHLAVEPAYVGCGIGKRLVDECIEAMQKVGLLRAIILVAGDNSVGRSFWKRRGWEEIDGALAMGIDVPNES